MNAQTALTIEHADEQPRAVVPVTPMAMLDRALATGASTETLEKLLALQERWEASQARKAFDEAMSAAKAEIPTIDKNRTVDFTSSKGRTHYRHEDLAGIARTVDPILSKHGLSYRFRTTNVPGEPITVTCIVSHRLGHSEENTLAAHKDESGNKNSIQAVGSTITYLQRYTLKAALGLAASNDDDGGKADQAADDGPITREEMAVLERLIAETDTDIAKFCALGGVESLSEIRASEFAAAKQKLETKKQRMQANG